MGDRDEHHCRGVGGGNVSAEERAVLVLWKILGAHQATSAEHGIVAAALHGAVAEEREACANAADALRSPITSRLAAFIRARVTT